MVADNARKILDTVAEICLQVGRDPRGVTVLAAGCLAFVLAAAAADWLLRLG